MMIKHYFALGTLAAAISLLSGCNLMHAPASTPTAADSSASADADAGSNEPDLMQKLKERMAAGPVKPKEKPVEKQASVATADSSKSPTLAIDPLKAQAAAAVAPDYVKAIGLMTANKDDEAMELLKKISDKAPNFSGPLLNQGLILIKQKKFADAQVLIQKAIDINPKNPYAFNMLGVTLREEGKFNDAKAAYETALSLDPNYAKAHFNLAVLADMYMQDLPVALEHYQRYQALQSSEDKAVGNWIVDLQKRSGTYVAKPAAAPAAAPAPAEGSAAPADANAANAQTATATPASAAGGAGGGASSAPAEQAPANTTQAAPAADASPASAPAAQAPKGGQS